MKIEKFSDYLHENKSDTTDIVMAFDLFNSFLIDANKLSVKYNITVDEIMEIFKNNSSLESVVSSFNVSHETYLDFKDFKEKHNAVNKIFKDDITCKWSKNTYTGMYYIKNTTILVATYSFETGDLTFNHEGILELFKLDKKHLSDLYNDKLFNKINMIVSRPPKSYSPGYALSATYNYKSVQITESISDALLRFIYDWSNIPKSGLIYIYNEYYK